MKRKTRTASFLTLGLTLGFVLTLGFSSLARAEGTLGFDMIPTRSGEAEARRAKLNAPFQERLAEDRRNLSFAQVEEIERIYQLANTQPKSAEAIENLKKMLENPDYQTSNRIGCALLYLATTESESANAEGYLKKAVESHGNSWYGDGVQVGPYARFLLAKSYWKSGEQDKARVLFEEIRAQYPESIDHKGELLVSQIPA